MQRMLHLALFEPRIPPNTGNVIRLAANTGAQLHLIEPLGFSIDHKQVKRAGLDYHQMAHVATHVNFAAFQQAMGQRRLFAIETCGTKRYDQVRYQDEDVLLFGAETYGLTPAVLEQVEPGNTLKLPMYPNNRSINLSNSCAIVLFEAWRQLEFPGAG